MKRKKKTTNKTPKPTPGEEGEPARKQAANPKEKKKKRKPKQLHLLGNKQRAKRSGACIPFVFCQKDASLAAFLFVFSWVLQQIKKKEIQKKKVLKVLGIGV